MAGSLYTLTTEPRQ